MKKNNLFLVILTIAVLILSCDKDPCNEGYTQLNSGVCVPDYIIGVEHNFDLGSVYYHSKLGVVNYINGNWYDENNLIIKNIND